ncbi:hypothetical protein ABZV81_26560 [Streptomyces parvus]|uniref:hypothetical protein n=1 Tax=Streptomyces parvus TaxID=66428 RepID=UPI0033B993A4
MRFAATAEVAHRRVQEDQRRPAMHGATGAEPTTAHVTRHLVLGDIARQYQVLEGKNTPLIAAELAPEPNPGQRATEYLRPADTATVGMHVLDGRTQTPVQSPANAADPVWAGLGPGTALTGSGGGAKAAALAAYDLACLAPLMLLRTHSTGSGGLTEVMMCSRVRAFGLVFVRVARFTHDADLPLPDLVAEALTHSSRLAGPVMSDGRAFEVLEPEVEIEQKINLLDEVSIWALTQPVCAAIEEGQYPGFFLDPGYELTRWQFTQDTFEVLSPQEQAGYFAFAKMPDGRYVLKMKTSERKAYRHEKTFRHHLEIPDDNLEAFLEREYPTYSFHRLPTLVRARFDINLESAETGHCFGISIDDVTVAGGHSLRQAEIEYLKTRVHDGSDHAVLDSEMDRLVTLVEENLKRLDVRAERSRLSKLTFLKNCEEQAAAAGLAQGG